MQVASSSNQVEQVLSGPRPCCQVLGPCCPLIHWPPCSHAQSRKPAPRSTQTRQGRAGRDKTNTPCEQEVTPHSGGIPSPLAHLPGARHIPAWLACPSGGPCPQAAGPGLNPHCRQGLLTVHPSPGPSRAPQHTSPSTASTAWRKIQCHCEDLELKEDTMSLHLRELRDNVSRPRNSRSHCQMQTRGKVSCAVQVPGCPCSGHLFSSTSLPRTLLVFV